ncbi:MAG: MOSC domain-containing protein [Phycisphaerales bacterium]|nr:MOSC domain-containing protein [Phycisphaerales bacterium]
MQVLSINTSPGGIPKLPRPSCRVSMRGLEGDAHNHEKHNHPDCAVSLLDLEMIASLREDGFELVPGSVGENLTLSGVNVQDMSIGDRLRFVNPDGSEGPEIELTKVRKPCFVLDAIHPDLQALAPGRIGFLAKVVREGNLVRAARVVAKPGRPLASD